FLHLPVLLIAFGNGIGIFVQNTPCCFPFFFCYFFQYCILHTFGKCTIIVFSIGTAVITFSLPLLAFILVFSIALLSLVLLIAVFTFTFILVLLILLFLQFCDFIILSGCFVVRFLFQGLFVIFCGFFGLIQFHVSISKIV